MHTMTPTAARGKTRSTTSALRWSTASYAVVSGAAMALPPVFPTTDPARVGYWALGAVICLTIFASTWRRSPPPRSPQLGAGWSLLGLTTHLGFLVGDLVAALIALPLSVAVLGLIAGQVRPSTRKGLLCLHVALSGMFLGVAAVMMMLAVLAAGADDIAVAHTHYAMLEVFDLTILPWVSMGSITSGLAVSLTGKWGLVKHYWVLFKFLLAVLAVASGILFVQGWVITAVRNSARLMAAGGQNVDPGTHATWVVGGFGFGAVLVLAATVLSVYKPWRRTRFGRRANSAGVRVRQADPHGDRLRTPTGEREIAARIEQ